MEYKVQKDQGHCQDYPEGKSQQKCYLEKYTIKDYMKPECKTVTNDTIQACATPQAETFLREIVNRTDLEQCITEESYKCMNLKFSTDPLRMNEKCPNPCKRVSYQLTHIMTTPIDMPYVGLIQLYYHENAIELQEEYLIFDFASILIAAGGSLGLFLGFSFLQFSDMTMDFFIWIHNSISKGLNKGRNF